MKSTYFFGFAVILFIAACSNSGSSKVETKDSASLPVIEGASGVNDSSSGEYKALEMVGDLPEVEDMREMVDRMSKGHNEVKLVVFGTPEPGIPYYTVKVMEDNGDNLVPQMCFRVYPDSSKIMFYDVAEDSAMTLEQWRGKQP